MESIRERKRASWKVGDWSTTMKAAGGLKVKAEVKEVAKASKGTAMIFFVQVGQINFEERKRKFYSCFLSLSNYYPKEISISSLCSP